MSLITQAPRFLNYESNFPATPASTIGTSVSHYVTTAHTKNPTWTQLLAASAFDAQLVVVTVGSNNSANTDTSTLLDIGIGASTAETVLIPDLLAGFANTIANCGPRNYVFPLYVPSGSRISARTASIRTTSSVNVGIQLFGGPSNENWWYGQQVTAYGINTADSGAVSMTCGNSGAELATPVAVGTTTANHKALVLGVSGNKATYSASLIYNIDVGIDVASTTWLSQDRYQLNMSTNETVYPTSGLWLPLWVDVASGTSLVVGGESSGTSEAMDFALYGVS